MSIRIYIYISKLNINSPVLVDAVIKEEVKIDIAAPVISNQAVLMRLRLKIESVQAHMVHRFTNLPLATLAVQRTSIEFTKKLDEILLDGSLGNLQLIDMSNYPMTLHEESQWGLIRPVELVGVKDSGRSLLNIRFRGLSEGSPKIGEDNTTTFVELKMSQININLMMQPIMRILDFTLSQLLFSLSNPALTVDPSEDEDGDGEFSPKKSQNNAMLYNPDEVAALQKQLLRPPGMSLLVEIENPQVTLKPSQASTQALIINLGHILVTNKRTKSDTRFMNQQVWVDTYMVVIKDIGVVEQGPLERTDLTLPFDFNVAVEMFPLALQYGLAYPNIEADAQIKIKCYMGPMIIQMTHRDYMFIMKCLFHNIAYDDGFDIMIKNENPKHYAAFFRDQEVQKKRAMVLLERGDTTPSMSFQLDAENLTAFLKTPTVPSVPFFRVTLVMLRVSFLKLNNGNSQLGLLARNLEGSVFNVREDGDYDEGPLLGGMSLQQVFSLNQITNLLGLVSARRFSNASQIGSALELATQGQLVSADRRNKVFCFEDADARATLKALECKLALDLQMCLNGDKLIKIDLADFRLMLHAGPILKVLAVIQMDDPTVTPEQGKFIRANEVKVEDAAPIGGSLSMKVGLHNVVICAPTNVDGNVLAIRGEFKVELKSSAALTVAQVLRECERQDVQLREDTREADRLNELMKLQVGVLGLEICICKAQDLGRQQDFRQVKKREILRPLDLELQLMKCLSLTRDQRAFIDKTSIELNLSRTEVRICFKDIVLLQSGMNYQMEQMNGPVDKQKVEEEQKVQVETDNDLNKKLQEMQQQQGMELDVKSNMKGIDIVILNDMGNSYTPILDFELYETKLMVKKNNLMQTLGFILPIRLSYYNPKVGKWEPVIERTGFNIDMFKNNLGAALEGTGSLLTIEQHPDYDFNIILSTMFFQSLFGTLLLLRKMSEIPKKKGKESIFEEEKEPIQQEDDELFASVSPYSVKNYSGFRIELNVIESQGLSKSRNDLHKPFQLTLQNNQQGNIMFQQQDMGKDSLQKRVRVTIFASNGKTYKTRDIDMDRIKSRVQRVDQDVQVFTSVMMDEVTKSKILLISSPITFINDTRQVIELQLSDRSHPTVEMQMESNADDNSMHQYCAVPVGYQHARIRMRVKGCKTYSDEVAIEKLQGIQEVALTDKRFVIMNVQQDENARERMKIHIQPPLRFTNSLPKSIYIQTLNSQKETTNTLKLSKGQTIEEFSHSFLKRSYLRVLMEGFYWSSEHRMYSSQLLEAGEVVSKEDCICEIPVLDMWGQQLSLLVYEPWRMDESIGCREFVIYSSGYIMNQSPYKLTYATIQPKKNTPVAIPGQGSVEAENSFKSECILMGPECGDQLSLSETTEDYSPNPTSIMGVGACQLDLLVNEDGVKKQVFMGGNIQLKLCNSHHLLFTKVISIEPRFIFVNQSNHILQVRSIDNQAIEVELHPQQRTPFTRHFLKTECKIEEKIWISLNLPLSADFQWSGDVDIASVGILYFQLKNLSDPTQRRFFQADTRQEGCNMFIIINEIEQANAPYKFINKCSDVCINVHELGLIIEPNSEYFYAWDQPCRTKKTFKYILEPVKQNTYKPSSYELKPDQIGLFKVFRVNSLTKGEPSLCLALSILPEGFQKKVILERATPEQMERSLNKNRISRQISIIDDEERKQESTMKQQVDDDLRIDSRMNVKITQLNISVMHNSDNRKHPAEYLNLTFKNIEVVQITKDAYKTSQVRIQYLNFDNNSQFYVNYPVILTPIKCKSYQKDKYFLNMLVQQDTKVKDINLFQQITFEIDPFAVKIEDQLITSVMEFANSILTFKSRVEEYEKRIEAQNNRMGSSFRESEEVKVMLQRDKALQTLHWYTDELPPPSLPTYINEIIISPIAIELTFELKSRTSEFQSDNMALFKSLAQALGVALTNIDEAPLNFNGMQLTNCFDTTSGIVNKMVLFYRDQGVKQVLKLLGSLSLLGNPVGLFNNISTGMTDLIERPVEGFTKGPLEGGLGLVQGAGSLVTHTIAGAFNSVNKITGSVSSGIASLSMDQEYIQQREQMRMQKPKHLIQGFEQAGKSLYQGFSQGIGGLFYKPFEGAKKDGLLGFGKGLMQGGIGLFTKPITGILDAAAKTTEGVKNTVMYYEDKPNETRERNIRPVYGPDGYYTDYVEFDAEAFTMVQLIKKGRYTSNKLFAAFPIETAQKDNQFILILTMENMFYMSVQQKKKIWIIPIEMFSNAERVDKGLKIRTKKELKELKDKKETVIEIHPAQVEDIHNQIIRLKEVVDYLN